MYAGISHPARSVALLVLAVAMSLAALENGLAQDKSKLSCPLRYEHADPHREDGSAVALRLSNGMRLGSLDSVKINSEQSLPTTLRQCIDEGLPKFREDDSVDAVACITPIASSFAEELRKVSQDVPLGERGTEALSRFRQKWRAIDSAIATDPLGVCAIGQLSNGSTQAEKFVVEVLNVMALKGANPALQRGYLRAVDLDALSEATVGCSHGCARLYWMRRILEK